MVTLRDVAERSGVSVMTASRALSGRGYVSKDSRSAVLEAAKSLGYIPNDVARSLRRRRSGIVAVVVSDIENEFYSTLAKTVERKAREEGYQVLICNTDEDHLEEARILNQLAEIRVEGIVITPTAHNAPLLGSLAESGMAIVQFDRKVDGLNCASVVINNARAALSAVTSLISLGHENIAFVSGPSEIVTSSERISGAISAAQIYNRNVVVNVYEASSFLRGDSTHAFVEALSAGSTAIITGNNMLAEEGVQYLISEGIQIGVDVAFMSFDNLRWMKWLHVPLTCIEQPIEEMATFASVQLFAHIRQPHLDPVSKVFEARLIHRESTLQPLASNSLNS